MRVGFGFLPRPELDEIQVVRSRLAWNDSTIRLSSGKWFWMNSTRNPRRSAVSTTMSENRSEGCPSGDSSQAPTGLRPTR
jgi:hypothetical protein